MRKQNKELPTVKCADCGFLCVLSQEDGSYAEANRIYRLEGFPAWQADTVFREPHCSMYYQDIDREPLAAEGVGVKLCGGGMLSLKTLQGKDVTDEAVLAIITKPRVCNGFYLWRPGFSPKEHYEMLERQRWEEWQERQRRSDQRWRMIELIVLGFIVTIIAGAFTILGAFIGRGSLFP